MSIPAGAKIGPYEIVALLGAGGMGEVYRARDSRLNRDVALKILLPNFAADAERMARFQREAQVLASLNHPHIAALYGLEDAGAKIGPYEIVALLGAGGMGEVYRGRDSRLGRDVALKILFPNFAADAERMARFQREAQVLASLNHPAASCPGGAVTARTCSIFRRISN